MHYRYFTSAFLTVWVATGAHALTLGSNLNSAVNGEPLDVQIQSRLDGGEDPERLCLEAEVFYSDRKVDSQQVQLQAEKTAVAGEVLIRVRTGTPVDGPVVTVHLRGGCQQKTVRRYTVLASVAPRLGATRPDAAISPDRLQTIESNLRLTQEQLRQSNLAQAQLRNQLEVARAERYFNGWVFTLLSMLGLALLGIFFLRAKLGKAEAALSASASGAQRTRSDALPSAAQEFSSRFGDLVAPAPSKHTDFSVLSALEPDAGLSVAAAEPAHESFRRSVTPSGPATLAPGAPLPRRDRNRFSVSVPHSIGGATAAELVDLQREVDRLTRRAEQARAVELLLRHLAKSVNTGMVVYLNLFHLYQQLDRAEDYEKLRADFNQVYNASIPPFGDFVSAGPGIEAQPVLLEKIQALWPQPGVLEILEAALFKPLDGQPVIVDLRACLDLLSLYEFARFMTESAVDFLGVAPGVDALQRAMTPPASRRLGVDIDLTEPAPPGQRLVGGDRSGSRAQAGMAAGPGVQGGYAGDSPRSNEVSFEPTLLDNLVDFDDNDTGYGSGDFPKPA